MEVAYRNADNRLAMEQDGRSFVFGDTPFMNATWKGVDALIRYGFIGKPPEARPEPAASIDPQSHMAVIAVVSSLAPDNYKIFDAGPATCAGGDPGHGVHLVALRDPLRYPISDAVVDMRSGDICTLDFDARVNAIAGLVGANGEAELHFAEQDGYVVVRDERIDVNLRAAGIAVKHVTIGVAFSNYAFPNEISPVVFATPQPSPEPSPKTVVSP
jgi:hypothetical protein